MVRLSVVLLVAFASILGAGAANAAMLTCTGNVFQQNFTVTGDFDRDAQTFTYSEDRYREIVSVKRTPAQSVHPLCGNAETILAEGVLSFEVTPFPTWGEYLLQLPGSATQEDGSFAARLHACEFDGAWRMVDDVPVQCTLSASEP